MFVRLRFGGQKRALVKAGDDTSVPSKPAEQTSSSPRLAPAGPVAVVECPAHALPPTSLEHPVRGTPRVKTYIVSEVRQAMSMARRELGENAILIQTNRLNPPQNDLKYEVIIGAIGGAPSSPVSIPANSELPARLSTTDDRKEVFAWMQEVGKLRGDIAALQAMMSRRYWGAGAPDSSNRPTIRVRNQLVQHGISPDLASEWILEVEDSLSAGAAVDDSDLTALMLEEQLRRRIRTDAVLGGGGSEGKAVMLLGPPGSGKTTAVLKLAVEHGIKRGRSIELWSLDALGGGVDHDTQCFAQLLNLPCRSFKSARVLASELGKIVLNDRLVLIDTKGIGCDSVDQDEETSNVLSSISSIDCHLVLPSVWHPKAVSRAVDRYEIFQPSRLLFTMLDQACTFGPILQEAWRTQKPLSFFSEGPSGSGQIQPASVTLVLNKISQVDGQ